MQASFGIGIGARREMRHFRGAKTGRGMELAFPKVEKVLRACQQHNFRSGMCVAREKVKAKLGSF